MAHQHLQYSTINHQRSLHWLLIVSILLLGVALRFRHLGQDVRFHSDESFFTTFAVNAAVHGDWMLAGPLDKSPLTIYAVATSLHFNGVTVDDNGMRDLDIKIGEFAARVPNTYASILMIALVMRLALVLSRRWQISYVAGALAACSPYLLVFTATAFTDVLMLAGMTAALLAGLNQRYLWAGIWLGVSIWAKQQGIYYLPLLLALIALGGGHKGRHMARFSIGLVITIGLYLLWDVTRPGASIFVLASENNNPGRLFADVSTWEDRLITWLGYLRWAIGPAWVTFPLLLISAWAVLRQRNQQVGLLWGYCGAFLLGHWLVAFNTYDRYLLPVIPLVIILSAYGLQQLPRKLSVAIGVVVAVPIFITGISAAGWGIDLGRDGYPLDREGELIALADYLNNKPEGTIIYDRWSGWELGYYLGPQTDKKRRVYYPTPQIMAEDALRNPERPPRYFIIPDAQWSFPWITALASAGFQIRIDYNTDVFTVYELIRP